MQVVLLAAGEGTRMRPLSRTVPKPMLPVGDRPLVAHAADAAVEGGADELVFVVGYRASAVRAYFGNEYRGVPITYAYQPEQEGTADAVRAAREYLDGPFVVLNGDNLYEPASIEALFSSDSAVCASRVPDPSNYGVLTTNGDHVVDVVEKPADPPSNLANAGAYAFPESALELLDVPQSERGEHEITDVLARVIESKPVDLVRLDRWMDVAYPWELLEANEWFLSRYDRHVAGGVTPDATLTGMVVVEPGATVESGVVVEGPAMIRSGASVGPNAYVRAGTVIGENAVVGHGVEVKNSVLCSGVTVGHLSYVGDSVLGRDVNFGAGTVVANLRHDEFDVRFTVNGERISTNRRKLGVVAGDGVKTGINTSLTPGLRLSPGARTHPGEVVDRDR